MKDNAKMSGSIHPECPVLHGSDIFVDPLHSETVAEIRVLGSSSHLVTDDVCALSIDMLKHDSKVVSSTSGSTPYFWCNFCPYATENKTSLVEHVTSHRFGCQTCPFHSYSRARVVQHVLSQHNYLVSQLGDLNYCKLVQSKDDTIKRKPWHKPFLQEMECGSQISDNQDDAVSDEKKFIIQRNEDFSNIHTRFKKYFVNRAAEAKTGLKNTCCVADASVTDDSDKQPVDFTTGKEENTDATVHSSCLLNNSLAISQTQKTFPTLKYLLASIPNPSNRPACEQLQTVKSNEENVYFPQCNGIKQNIKYQPGKIDKMKFMQYSSKTCNKDLLTNVECQSMSGPSKSGENTPHLNTALQKVQRCLAFSSRTMSDPGTLKAPDEDYSYPDTSYTTTRNMSVDSGIIKYIYDENYNGRSNEYVSESKLYPHHHQLKYLQLQSNNVKMEVCETGEENRAVNGSPNDVIANSANDDPLVQDSAIKIEPLETGLHSFISSDTRDANTRFISLASAVQYPINENIELNKESCESDEEHSDRTTYGKVHHYAVSKTSDYGQFKTVSNKIHKMKNVQDFQSGRNIIPMDQYCITSTQSNKSRIVWDCGQCEFQSNDYKQYKMHACSVYVAYNDKLNNFNNPNDKTLSIQPSKKQIFLKRKVVTGDFDAPISLQCDSSKTYSCRTCNFTNASSDDVKSHNQKQHLPSLLTMYRNNTVVFYCPENCDYMSDDYVDYLSHIKQCRGSLLEAETIYSNVFQASLMLTLRHILTTDKAAFKRMFLCASCNFETNSLADITSHTSVHSNSKNVTIRLDPCNRKVTWFCLQCRIPINLMQLKKHVCNKPRTLECSDPLCHQCCSGMRKSMYVCVTCKYQTECLLMITKHSNDDCKGLYKEVTLNTSNPEEIMHCPRCDETFDGNEISSHKCITQNKSTVSGVAQFENSMQRRTRSSLKTVHSNTPLGLPGIEQVEEGKTRSSVDGEQLTTKSKAITKTEQHILHSQKRKRVESEKQVYSKSLKTLIIDTFETLPICVQTKDHETRKSITEGIINARHCEVDKCITKHTQIKTVSQNENYDDDHKAHGDNETSDDRPIYKHPIKKHWSKLQRSVRPESSTTTWVPIEVGNTQRNSIPSESQVSVTTVPLQTTTNKEVNESEFQPLSMLEWLNTESQRMLKLLKP